MRVSTNGDHLRITQPGRFWSRFGKAGVTLFLLKGLLWLLAPALLALR